MFLQSILLKFLILMFILAQVEGNLRIMLISRLGNNRHQQTIDEAKRQFSDHIHNISSIHVDTRQAIFSVIAYNGDSSTIDQLLDVC